jgi:RNase P subunit RPR2
MPISKNLEILIRERIEILLNKAAIALKQKQIKYAKRYVFLARKLMTRFNIRPKKEDKVKFCKVCGYPWLIGKNVFVRLAKGYVEYRCSCGAKRRFKYS